MTVSRLGKAILNAIGGEALVGEVHARLWAQRLRASTRRPLNPYVVKYVEAGDICVDVGAHGGSFAIDLSRRVGSSGAVVCFEALPYYAATLRRALGLIGVDNVTVHNTALSDRDCTVQMVTVRGGAELTGRTHIHAQGENLVEHVVETRAAALDTLMVGNSQLARANFVKIDVEGAELMVLNGARHFITTARPVIYCEIVDAYCQRYGHSLHDVVNLIKELGYHSEKVTSVDYLLTPK